VVEGFCDRSAEAEEAVRYCVRVVEYVPGRNPNQLNDLATQPLGAGLISLRPIPHIVRRSIDFDRELGSRAVKVEHVRPNRMLSADTEFRSAQSSPQ
jgi:hypothetical protein